jgi:hypothetical protein
VRFELEELRKACGSFKILGTYPVDMHRAAAHDQRRRAGVRVSTSAPPHFG